MYVPDEIPGEIGSELDQARFDPFQPFESEFKSPRSQGGNDGDFSNASEPMEMITGDIEQSSCKEMSQLPVSQLGRDPSSASDSESIDKPSLEEASTGSNSSITEHSSAVTEVSISSPKATTQLTTSHSSDVSGVVTTPKSTCESGVNPARPNSVSPFVKPKLSAGASLPEKENLVKGTHTKESVSLSTTRQVLTDITEFLNYPSLTSTPKSRAKKPSGPRVLTSAEAIAILEEEEKQKRSRQ